MNAKLNSYLNANHNANLTSSLNKIRQSKNKQNKKQSNKHCGVSLLEFVITLPITMLFLFGVTDIMRVLSAQTAIDSGTEAALRCLAPINGDCAASPSSNYVKTFDVYKLNQANTYLTDGYAFSATANTVNANKYETNVSAEVLTHGYAKIKPFKTIYQEKSYPASVQTSYYLMTRSLPKILGNASSLESQKFVLKNNEGVNYKPTVKNNSPFSLIIDKEKKEASGYKYISFTIPSDKNCPQTLPCFVSKNIDKRKASRSNEIKDTNFNKTCNLAFSWKNNDKFGRNNEIEYKEVANSGMVCKTTPILLFVKGNASIADKDAAKVDIDLLDKKGNLIRSLGGRSFDKQSSASLVARGAETENYSSDLQNKFKDAELTFHQAIQIDYDKEYQIRFKLERTNSSANDKVVWNFDELNIFTPEYELKNIEDKCKNHIFLTETDKEKLKRCSLENIPSSALDSLTFTFNIPSSNGTPSGNKIESSCSLQKASLEEILIKNKINSDFQSAFVESKPIPCSGFETIKYDCQAQNLGAKTLKEYDEACPLNISKKDYAWLDYFKPVNTREYDTKTIKLGTTTWQKNDCFDKLENHLDPSFNKYKVLKTENKNIGQDAVDLSNDKFCDNFNTEKFNCSDFSITSKKVEPTEGSQFQTLLFGTHVGELCEWKNDGWKDVLYDEIKTNWNNEYSKSCFHMQKNKSGKKTLSSIPSDDCVEYFLSSNQSNETKNFLGNFNENSIPEECTNSTSVCEIKFTGFKKTANTSGESDFEKAKNIAFNTIQKLFPNSSKDCNNNYCLNFESQENNNDVLFTSKMKLPIYTLLGKEIEIKSSSIKAKEKF
ncbi:MAG: TadE/TadG family type IV pilus assembly protein [Bdellovibrionota bacterium]